MEMVSVCTEQPNGDERCTSSPIVLGCGQAHTLETGERLRCECDGERRSDSTSL
jgi:hypothetical protein